VNKFIHIVSFDVPYPANYGGVIDVYYRLLALSNAGYKIHLHCFDYGRGKQKKLEALVQKVYYYQRKSLWKANVSSAPMIVASRKNPQLLANLKQNNWPILFEGQHCTAYLDHPSLTDRIKIVRLHNIEHNYYRYLAAATNKLWKKFFFLMEAQKLQKQEKKLSHASALLCINENDLAYYVAQWNNCYLSPIALPLAAIEHNEKDNYVLYHGNLSVEENENAVLWLLRNVATEINCKFVIAGKNPSKQLRQLINQFKNIELIANPSDEALNKLLKSAKAHLLYSEQATGLKLKLLRALQNNAPVFVNQTMVEGTQLHGLCMIFESAPSLISAINECPATPLDKNDFEIRMQALAKLYAPSIIEKQLDKLLFAQ